MKVVSVPDEPSNLGCCHGGDDDEVEGAQEELSTMHLDKGEFLGQPEVAGAENYDDGEDRPTLPGAEASLPQRMYVETCPATTGYKLPLVKLDLGGRAGLASAITGVMTQPSAEKICTLQVEIGRL